MPTTISKSALKARMLELLREVEASGEELIVTSNGKPVVKVVPYRRKRSVDEVFGDVRGTVRLPPDEELNAPLGGGPFADSELRELL